MLLKVVKISFDGAKKSTEKQKITIIMNERHHNCYIDIKKIKGFYDHYSNIF